MSDVAGIVLHSILKNPESVIDVWPKLKLQYFNTDYSQIFVAITKYYNKYNEIPTFESLEITTRDQMLVQKLFALSMLEVNDDIDINIAVDALIDQYTQEETLDQLWQFTDKIVTYSSEETKLKLSEILNHLEEQTENSEEIFLMNDMFVVDKEAILARVPLGLNNTFDAHNSGVALTELIMVGGYRGSGKTVAACNITANQYLNGNVGLFFSIEMRNREIFGRFMSILGDVDNNRIKTGRLTTEDFDKLAKVRKDMFLDSEEVYQDYLKHSNYEQFEIDLIRSKKLKQHNQIITIDNQFLTLADIDMTIKKFKSIHGDKLNTVVVDYVNQIVIPEQYNWQSQIALSKKLKDLAAKHEVVMITPYQVDNTGEARFAKGLLDAADIAVTLEAKDEWIHFKSTKTRGYAPFEFNAPITWDTFYISPLDAVIPEEDSEKPKEKATDLEV